MTWTMNVIKDHMRASGSHWFDPDTMRYFRCRIAPTVYQGPGGIYFVSSEQFDGSTRRYSVRQFHPASGDIGTVGEFNSMSAAQAKAMSRRLARTPLHEQWENALYDISRGLHETGGIISAPDLDGALGGSVIKFGSIHFSVVGYEDGSGCYLRAEPHTFSWSRQGVDAAAQEAARVARTKAHGDYVAEPHEESAPFRPVSPLEQLLDDIRAHGDPLASEASARALVYAAERVTTFSVDHCNGTGPYAGWNGEEPPSKVRDAHERFERFAKAIGARADIGGDPRGHVARIVFPDGFSNALNGEGYCVPTCVNG